MQFQTVPINVTGPTYQSRSRPLSSQRTVNMYQQFDEKGKDPFTLHSFYGQEYISEVADGEDRGVHRMNEILYRIVGKNFYEVDSVGAHTLKGTLTGTGRCIMEDDGDNLVIIADVVYVYTASTGVFKQNYNINLVDILSVTIINNQFIYTSPSLSFMAQPGDPFDVSGLDAIAAESSPDSLVRDYVFNQTIYRMGQRTGEPWYNSGVGSPPIDRIDGQEFAVGVGAIHTLGHTDNAMYWLGDDKAIYRVSGGIVQRISDDGLSNTIEEMTTISDAFGYPFTIQGQDFYLITFPSESRTFVINEKLGANGWFELSSGNQGDAYSGTSMVQVYNEIYVANRGKLLKLNKDRYTQDTDTMVRERITQSFGGELLGVKGQRVKMSRLELIMEAGVGLITGQGVLPRVLIETSIDGGRSFKHSAWVNVGRMGQNTLRVELWQLISGESFIFRIRMSDPVPLSIYSATLDIKLAGR